MVVKSKVDMFRPPKRLNFNFI